jgi:hypothetical protein
MRYRVHRVEIREDDAEERLAQALERLEGELMEIVPLVHPVVRPFGPMALTTRILIVEGVAD